MARDTGRHTQTTTLRDPDNLEENIRRRAYELYEERGREDGRELDDWLRAEEELRQRRRTFAA
jgi:outer membrane protein TolC